MGLFPRELQERLEALPAVVEAAYDSFHFYEGIVAIMDVLRLTNSFVQVIWAAFCRASLRQLRLSQVYCIVLIESYFAQTSNIIGNIIRPF